MKRIIPFILAVIMLFSVAYSESAPAAAGDITYKTLYTTLVQAMREEDGAENQLVVGNASVWKVNDDIAGFAFQGDDWQIYGETDMETGLVTRLLCRLPYTKAGLLMTYMVAYILSEEETTQGFINKYVGTDSLLNGVPFPHYANTLDAGNDNTLVYEFSRVGSVSLEEEANKCSMKELILQIQSFQ